MTTRPTPATVARTLRTLKPQPAPSPRLARTFATPENLTDAQRQARADAHRADTERREKARRAAPYRQLIAPPIIPIADFNPHDYLDDETG